MNHPNMPPPAPLDMRPQDFAKAPRLRRSLPREPRGLTWRVAVFAPALLGTAFLIYGLYSWLAGAGMSGLEWALLAMIGATFVWVTLSVSTVGVGVAGLLARDAGARHKDAPAPLDVALVVPIYNEVPWEVFGNALAMLNDLSKRASPHRFTLFILSDTSDDAIAAQEGFALERLRRNAPAGLQIHYRRRPENIDKKVGNLLDWITGWGAAHDAMLVLDADSLMTGRAICRLADEMSRDPDAGLIQSFPMLIGAHTLFARLQQFSNIAYGWLLAEGLALWSRDAGNYWGHNAMIRIRAFADCAGLPRLKGRKGGLILSHDFVEAGLLRRAGWRVRFLPRLSGSFEETPATLVEYTLRDRRWCRGNLQHLRLLGTKGLHPVSRFHMLHGAVAYLLSPAWFILLVFWSLLGKDAETNVIRYFNEANPLFPDWPPAMSHIDSAVFLVIMYAMLLTPKLAGAGIIACTPKAIRAFGGARAFGTAFGVEVVLSIAYAPIMMIQQSKAVLRALFSQAEAWSPQNRGTARYGLGHLAAFHWLETAIGLVLFAGLWAGLLSLWLVPIMLSLLLAIPLSALSGFDLASRGWAGLRMDNPVTLREPRIVREARKARHGLRKGLSADQGKLPAQL